MTGYDFQPILDSLPVLLDGAATTLRVSALALGLAFALGLLTALARLSSLAPIRLLARGYVDVFRGTPPLVQIFFVYFGLPQLGVDISVYLGGVLALGLYGGAYLGEIFRAGIQSIDVGQQQAARALGISHSRMMRSVVLPQAALRVIPPTTGQLTILVKGSALLSSIGLSELTRVGQQIASVTFQTLEVYLVVAAIYLVINLSLAQLASILDARLRRNQGIDSILTNSVHAGGV